MRKQVALAEQTAKQMKAMSTGGEDDEVVVSPPGSSDKEPMSGTMSVNDLGGSTGGGNQEWIHARAVWNVEQ